MASRFVSLTEQDIEKIVEDKDSQNTKRSTKVAKELFADYVKEKNLRKRKSWHKLWKHFMSKRERKMVRLTPWGVWKPSDLAWTDILNQQDIINDVEFNEANKVFTAQCVQLKKDGQAKVQHKPPILDDIWPFSFRSVYNKTIIRFGFCDIQNNQGLGKGYQPQPSASADNPYLDLDYSGYHKNHIQ